MKILRPVWQKIISIFKILWETKIRLFFPFLFILVLVSIILWPWLTMAFYWLQPNFTKWQSGDNGYLFTYTEGFIPKHGYTARDRRIKLIYGNIIQVRDKVLADDCAKCDPDRKEKLIKYLKGEIAFDVYYCDFFSNGREFSKSISYFVGMRWYIPLKAAANPIPGCRKVVFGDVSSKYKSTILHEIHHLTTLTSLLMLDEEKAEKIGSAYFRDQDK